MKTSDVYKQLPRGPPEKSEAKSEKCKKCENEAYNGCKNVKQWIDTGGIL